MAEFRICRASRPDAPCLAAIDAECSLYPWSEQAFLDSFSRAEALWALDTDDRPGGFVLFSTLAENCEILLIAVRPSMRRRGIARTLLQSMFREAAVAGACHCILDVRESNAAAIALYGAMGFRIDARRKGYYRSADGQEDALLMSRLLSD